MKKIQHVIAKALFLFFLLNIATNGYGQDDTRITVIDFVQVVNDNKAEAIFYYENNWKVLRDMAVEKEYIKSYELLETPYNEDAPFHLMLVTTFKDKEQYDLSEPHFDELIEIKGDLKLLNEKKPGEFRKIIFHKDMIRHLN